MLKRFFVLLLALCCAFSFICQTAAATGAEVLLSLMELGMALSGSFGITFASDAGYESFANLMHEVVIDVPDGPAWWSRCLQGQILFATADIAVKEAIRLAAAKAADTISTTSVSSTITTFTLSSFVPGVTAADYRGKELQVRSYEQNVYHVYEYVYHTDSSAYWGISVYSNAPFQGYSSYWEDARFDSDTGLYRYQHCDPSSYFSPLQRVNCTVYSSKEDFFSHVRADFPIPVTSSSAGGAAAAYAEHGFDGVSLPDMDLTQPGLINEDGTSTVSDLVGQLQSGAITWEDFMGTVAPGQTATITLTDENGAAVTYTLVNSGVGTRVESVPDVSEATEPVVVPGTGELTGTLADTDAKSFLGSLADTIGNTFADVIAGVKAIPGAISDVIAEVKAIPAAITDAFAAAKPSGLDHLSLDLRQYFPFCVPFDMYDFFMCLRAAPEAPVIDWEIQLPGGKTYPIQLDLSVFDPVALLLRRLELLLFCVGLAFKTRDLIKG